MLYELTKPNRVPVVSLPCSPDVREHLWQCERHNPAALLGHHAVPLGHAAGMDDGLLSLPPRAFIFCAERLNEEEMRHDLI